jgi:hypothetical protein
MNPIQKAKIIMALNNIGTTRAMLSDALKEGGPIAERLSVILQKVKECEEALLQMQREE